MEKYTINDYLEKYGNCKAISIISIVCLKTPMHMRNGELEYYINKFKDVSFEIPSVEETIKLLSVTNKFIKLDSVPKNVRNKFYDFKKKFVKFLYKNNYVDAVIESENLYKFIVGDYEFHQLKNVFKEPLPVNGTEVYKPDILDDSIVFDDSIYRLCMCGISHYVMKET